MPRPIVLRIRQDAPIALAPALADRLLLGPAEDELRSYLRSLNVADAAQAHIALSRWSAAGALVWEVGRVARMEVTAPGFAALEAIDRAAAGQPRPVLRLSPWAAVRREGDHHIIEHPTRHARVVFWDAQLVGPALACDWGRAPSVCRLLARAGLLVSPETPDLPARWEPHDLWFHARSRRSGHAHRLGATYRFGAPDHLKRPPGEHPGVGEPGLDAPFFSVLDARQSLRRHSERPMGREALMGVLDAALAWRGGRPPYPSAGALYPVSAWVAVRSVAGLAPGLYRYDPRRAELARHLGEIGALLQGAAPAVDAPHCVVILTARLRASQEKYEGIAYRLVLLEVGAVLQNLQLAAAALDLASCLVGTGAPDALARLTGRDALDEPSMAELTLGRRPERG